VVDLEFEQHSAPSPMAARQPVATAGDHDQLSATNPDYEQWLTEPGATSTFTQGAPRRAARWGIVTRSRNQVPDPDHVTRSWCPKRLIGTLRRDWPAFGPTITFRRWRLQALSDNPPLKVESSALARPLTLPNPIRSLKEGIRVRSFAITMSIKPQGAGRRRCSARVFPRDEAGAIMRSPPRKKAREKAEAVRRARKLARKKLQREGLCR